MPPSCLPHTVLTALSTGVPKPPPTTWKSLKKSSKDFFGPTPTTDNWLRACIKRKELAEDEAADMAANSYPILSEDTFITCHRFLEWKKENGNTVEKALYKEMDLLGLVQRLIAKRPLSFVGACDGFTDRSKKHGSCDWDAVATDPKRLADYMSYDEIKLAALLQVSSQVAPINTGSRDNIGRKGHGKGAHVKRAVYVGAVGARFEKKDGRMEWQDVVVGKELNHGARGYGPKDKRSPNILDVFAQHYGLDHFPNFEEAKDFPGMTMVDPSTYFNTAVYQKRIETSAEIFLLEANVKAGAIGKKAFVHVVGLGLGVWMYIPHIQRQLYLAAFQESFLKLNLPNVKRVDFSWVGDIPFEGKKLNDGETLEGTDIKISFSRRDPFSEPTAAEDKDLLIVAMYAWDGNSFPGNEYWDGSLAASGDPAAACCTQIPELQNAYINSEHICARNLHIACAKYGVVHVAEYAKKVLEDMG